MNISLSKASNKSKKPNLSMGLNTRGGTNSTSVFLQGDDDDEEDDEAQNQDDPTGRAAVNRAIAQEQAALRARAAAAAQKESDYNDIYDYDKAYDSFHPKEDAEKKKDTAPRQSRYIQDLLQTAAQRQIERDIAQERKVARELMAEEADDPELRLKERFVTASYKRKLEERKLWQERQAQLDEQDAQQPSADGGMAIASFYGNLTQKKKMNVESSNHIDTPSQNDHLVDDVSSLLDDASRAQEDHIHKEQEAAEPMAAKSEDDPVERRKRLRQIREEKVQQARLRYFKRHGLE